MESHNFAHGRLNLRFDGDITEMKSRPVAGFGKLRYNFISGRLVDIEDGDGSTELAKEGRGGRSDSHGSPRDNCNFVLETDVHWRVPLQFSRDRCAYWSSTCRVKGNRVRYSKRTYCNIMSARSGVFSLESPTRIRNFPGSMVQLWIDKFQ